LEKPFASSTLAEFKVILTDFAGLREKGLTHPMMGEIEQKFNSPEGSVRANQLEPGCGIP
jgi:hypothetical protein